MIARMGFFGAVLLLVACVSAPPAPASTAEQDAWYDHRNAQATTFLISGAESELAWGRAKVWISRWSDFKLQIVDTAILETYNPIGDTDFKYGYSVSREQQPDGSWRFDVRAVSAAGRLINNSKLEHLMAQALALYIVTGEEFPGGHGTGDRSRY